MIFRAEGYIDLVLRETHEQEQSVVGVEMLVTLTGQLPSGVGTVTFSQEGERLEDGTTWGARFALPREMTSSSRQDYRLIVYRRDGGVRDFHGETTQNTMGARNWTSESDPTGADWDRLESHMSANEASAGSASPSSASFTAITPPWNLSIEDIFDQYGAFTIYRVKPFAATAESVSTWPNASALAVSTRFEVPVDENSTPIVNSTFNIATYTDAFEQVPLSELGPYQTNAAGSRMAFRSMRFLWSGLPFWPTPLVTKSVDPCEIGANSACYALVYGSDDPRAAGGAGGFAADILAAFLVYGDVRDLALGTMQGKPWKASLGALGILLTAYPALDASVGSLKVEMKILATIPGGGGREARTRNPQRIRPYAPGRRREPRHASQDHDHSQIRTPKPSEGRRSSATLRRVPERQRRNASRAW